MVKNQMNESEVLDAIVTSPYKYGFTTDIENFKAPKGLSEETIKFIAPEYDFEKLHQVSYQATLNLNKENA